MDVHKEGDDYDPKKYDGKDEKRHFDKNTDVRTIKSETLIDGCGKPVIPEIERKKIIISGPEDDSKFVEDGLTAGMSQADVGFNAVKARGGRWINTPERKPTTTVTHCSCGSEFRKGIVLDIFMGSGTTGIVARALGRDYVGIELNPEYIEIAKKRLKRWTPDKVLDKLGYNKKQKKKRLMKSKRGLLKGL